MAIPYTNSGLSESRRGVDRPKTDFCHWGFLLKVTAMVVGAMAVRFILEAGKDIEFNIETELDILNCLVFRLNCAVKPSQM